MCVSIWLEKKKKRKFHRKLNHPRDNGVQRHYNSITGCSGKDCPWSMTKLQLIYLQLSMAQSTRKTIFFLWIQINHKSRISVQPQFGNSSVLAWSPTLSPVSNFDKIPEFCSSTHQTLPSKNNIFFWNSFFHFFFFLCYR